MNSILFNKNNKDSKLYISSLEKKILSLQYHNDRLNNENDYLKKNNELLDNKFIELLHYNYDHKNNCKATDTKVPISNIKLIHGDHIDNDSIGFISDPKVGKRISNIVMAHDEYVDNNNNEFILDANVDDRYDISSIRKCNRRMSRAKCNITRNMFSTNEKNNPKDIYGKEPENVFENTYIHTNDGYDPEGETPITQIDINDIIDKRGMPLSGNIYNQKPKDLFKVMDKLPKVNKYDVQKLNLKDNKGVLCEIDENKHLKHKEGMDNYNIHDVQSRSSGYQQPLTKPINNYNIHDVKSRYSKTRPAKVSGYQQPLSKPSDNYDIHNVKSQICNKDKCNIDELRKDMNRSQNLIVKGDNYIVSTNKIVKCSDGVLTVDLDKKALNKVDKYLDSHNNITKAELTKFINNLSKDDKETQSKQDALDFVDGIFSGINIDLEGDVANDYYTMPSNMAI